MGPQNTCAPPLPKVVISVKRFQLPVWRQAEAVNHVRSRVSTLERRASNNDRFYSVGAPNSTRGANANNTDELMRLQRADARGERDRRAAAHLSGDPDSEPSGHQTPGSDVRPECSGSSRLLLQLVILVPLASQCGKFVVYLEFLDRTGSFFILTASLKP